MSGMGMVLVVLSTHYSDWRRVSEGEVEVFNENVEGPNLVGVYTSVEDCAKACYSFIDEFEADEDRDGPIEDVRVHAAEMGAPPGTGRYVAGAPPGTGRYVATLKLTGSTLEFEEQLRKALA